MRKEDIISLSQLYGNEFYIFDPDKFEYNIRNIDRIFSKYYSGFHIAYSYKTNYLPECCRIVDELGGYAEIVSEMELEIAHRCGVKNEDIIWNGPVKSMDPLSEFLLSGGVPNIDNIAEWKRISEVAEKILDHTVFVGLRCNFDIGDGVVSRFGVEAFGNDFIQILREIKEQRNVELYGIQCHFANRELKYWKNRIDGMLRIYKYISEEFQMHPKRIDLGGGMSGEMSSDFARQIRHENCGIDDYAKQSAFIAAEYFKDNDDAPELVIEPGTAIVADTMKLVCQVKNIRCIRGKWIATVSASQKNISMQGINPPLEIIHINDGEKYEDLDIAGFTCIESDYLYRGYDGELAAGDYVVFDYCGSYSLVYKPPFINPNIPVIGVGRDVRQAKLLKRRETIEDVLCTYD